MESSPTSTVTSKNEKGDSVDRENVVLSAQEASRGGLWSDEMLNMPLTWAGDDTKKKPTDDKPRLGGLGRPEAAYAKILPRLTGDEISALVEVIHYELMMKYSIPGKNIRDGLVSIMSSRLESKANDLKNYTAQSAPPSGVDKAARQQLNIIESKIGDIEAQLVANRQQEIALVEHATDILADYEAKKRDEQADAEEINRLIEDRDHLTKLLDDLKQQQAVAAPKLVSSSVSRPKPRNFGLF